MAQYKPQKKHKAQHGNYYSKPTKKDVNALNGLYQGICDAMGEMEMKPVTVTKRIGEQLTIKFK